MNNHLKINIENLNLFIDKTHILKNINITIPENKITVILGPSGCGKTTLLKTLNRLTDLYENLAVSGKIIIDGEDILNTSKD
ncbi:MAG: ATP-binding cassette domain-containing protein, partial [Bacteroidota bacterium]